jgi:predicted PurR-regulated permease PerM
MSSDLILALVVLFLFSLFVGLGWFLIARVWPYATQQLERDRAARSREQEQFLSVLAAHARSAEGSRQIMGQVQQVLSLQTTAIQRLVDTIDRERKKGPHTS